MWSIAFMTCGFAARAFRYGSKSAVTTLPDSNRDIFTPAEGRDESNIL